MANYLNFVKYSYLIFFLIAPITFISTALNDIFISLISLISLPLVIRIKLSDFKNYKELKYIFCFYIILILLSFFSIDLMTSLPKSLVYIRFLIAYVILRIFIINNITNREIYIFKKIFTYLILSFIFFLFMDLFYQFLYGVDLFSKESLGRRLTGPFDKLAPGKYLSNFFLVFPLACFLYFRGQKFSNLFFYLIMLLIFSMIIVTYERMALYNAIIVFALFFILMQYKIKTKLFIIFIITVAVGSLLIKNDSFYDRYVNQTIMQVQGNTTVGSEKKVIFDHYGYLFQTSYNIFIENPLVGTGIKTFRIKCKSEEYNKIGKIDFRCSTHPHNVVMELISELGLIGLISFYLMMFHIIKNNFKVDNIIGLIFFIQLFTFISPFQISGSLFNNWISCQLWYLIYLGIFLSKTNYEK